MRDQSTDEYIAESILRTKMLNVRKSVGLTQAELAEKSGLSKSCISNIESIESDTTPNLMSLIKYINALGYRLTVVKSGEKLDER